MNFTSSPKSRFCLQIWTDFKKPPRRVGENKRSYVDGLNVFWAAPRSPASLSPNSHHKRLTWTLNTCHFLFFPTNRRIYQNAGSNLAGAILTSIKHCLVYLFLSSFTDILPASEMSVDYKERHKKRIRLTVSDKTHYQLVQWCKNVIIVRKIIKIIFTTESRN